MPDLPRVVCSSGIRLANANETAWQDVLGKATELQIEGIGFAVFHPEDGEVATLFNFNHASQVRTVAALIREETVGRSARGDPRTPVAMRLLDTDNR